jgi:hypothetical protein
MNFVNLSADSHRRTSELPVRQSQPTADKLWWREAIKNRRKKEKVFLESFLLQNLGCN